MEVPQNLRSEDEYWHDPVSDSPKARESYYFDFYDPDSGLSGYTSIGYRHNKGYMGSYTTVIWDGSVYVRKDYGRPTENEAVQVEGLAYELVEPLEEWRLRQLTTINEFPPNDPEPMMIEAPEYPVDGAPLHAFDMDLHCEGIHDPVDYHTDATEEEKAVIEPLYERHYEQVYKVTGEITIGDTTIDVDGYGDRDHSWGNRDWLGIGEWEWLAVGFDDDTGMSCIVTDNEMGRFVDGFIYTDGETRAVDVMEIDREDYEGGGFDFRIVDAGGRELTGTATVDETVPTDIKSGDEVGQVVRCPTTFTLDSGKTGYGWSDYLA